MKTTTNNIRIYTPGQITKMVKATNDLIDLAFIYDYLAQNAVQFIEHFGGASYNGIIFMLNKKSDQLGNSLAI